MSDNFLMILMGVAGGLFAIIAVAYIIISKKLKSSEVRKIQQLRAGTKEKNFSSEMTYQKLYIKYSKIPGIRRYLLKLRRRLEILNLDDEYLTRGQASKMLTRALVVAGILSILILAITYQNTLLCGILLIVLVFLIETFMDSMVDKMDNKLLKQQIHLFSEIRHAYHEFNMVEEAIYQVAQEDELEVSRQAEKIYEILISDNPEEGLEKYYDIAPNSYLKEFAGVSYLTKEFGDRTVNGGSLYLKNLNNITQEMQLEILKRDKLDYVFQSLSIIAVAPVLFIEPIKNWSVNNFSFTESFYNGKIGTIVQILLLVLTIISYILTKKLKDNGSTASNFRKTDNPWQAKLYKKEPIKKLVDMFIPKKGTKELRIVKNLLKDSASPLKIEWLYINKICLAVLTCVASIFLFTQIHKMAVDYVYTEPTTDYNIIGQISDKDKKKAMQVTLEDNTFIDKFRGQTDVTLERVQKAVEKSKYYEDATDEEIATASQRIFDKIQTVNSEYMQWFELLLSIVFGIVAYNSPTWLMKFQLKMRQLEMENEVMQFHTIILMLMKIERVNVEMILEWLERYSNIFREPITKCVNNYESGAWEALEELKNEISYPDLVRIVETMQTAVEKIPIAQAFDELDTERAYYQEKRKESNERLISRKGMIGKAIGFTPMVCLFVGYLIVPLVFVGFSSMTQTFSNMTL